MWKDNNEDQTKQSSPEEVSSSRVTRSVATESEVVSPSNASQRISTRSTLATSLFGGSRHPSDCTLRWDKRQEDCLLLPLHKTVLPQHTTD